MYVVNRFGRVVDVEEDFGRKMIAAGTFRIATNEEIAIRESDLLRKQNPSMTDSVYYNTVESRPDGYGMSRDYIQREVARNGVNLTEKYQSQKVGLLYGYPTRIGALKTRAKIVFTMFESDKIPDSWVEPLKEADEVLVPSTFCKDTFERAGITARVIPLGYNDDVFTYTERDLPVDTGKEFTFIHYDSFNIRKGFSEVFEAFTKEFEKTENVRLILKTTEKHIPFPILESQYPNITVIKENMSEGKLHSLLARANCMVYPSKGEGFGITPLEAMATGIPVIAPNAHGISEYFNADVMYGLLWERQPAIYRKFKGEDVGSMIGVNIEDLRRKMRYVYNHQEEAREKGKAASEYVKQYTYKETAKKLTEVLKKWQSKDIKKKKTNVLEVVEV